MKVNPVSAEPREVRYIALPSASDIQSMVTESQFNAYCNAQAALQRAQVHMASIAIKAINPDVFHRLDGERRYAIRLAQDEFAKGAMEFFSEICTKGL